MTAFRGNHPAKVDPKGRLKLPSGFKELLDKAEIAQFYITSTDGKKAEVWPLPEWEKREALLAESSNMDDAVEKYLNLTSYYGQQVEVDKEGRVLLPQILRERAGLKAEVVILGKLNFLEVHNQEVYEQNVSANALTTGDRQTLSGIFKGQG
jgi:MraZ protein